MIRYVGEDRGQCAYFDGIVGRYRDVMLAVLGCGQANVTAGLAVNLITEGLQSPSKDETANVAWQLHAASTSSLTK